MQRVFVTGLGAVTPLGDDAPATWAALVEGRSGIGRLTRIKTDDLPTRIGGEVRRDVDEAVRLEPKQWRHLDRATRFAVIAAGEALEDAGLPTTNLGPRVAVVLGAGLSGMETLQIQTERLLELGPGRVSPHTIPELMPNATAGNVCLAFGVTGASYVTSSACASSAQAVVDAYEMIRRGAADVVITGGAESSLTRLGIASFCRMKAMATGYDETPEKACRPFDRNRRGLVMSEGAGVVVLESEEHMLGRGAKARAEVVGYGVSTDAYHIVAPHPDATGARSAIEQALAMANVAPGEIASRTYVNAHGTGTPMNDALETKGIKLAFGEAAADLRISSTKSATGHLIGAAGGLELLASTLAVRNGVVPPTLNLDDPDPDCDLDYTPHEAREADLEYALSNSFAFGGHNVCLLIRRADTPAN